MSQHQDGIQGFSKPTQDLVLWAADSHHTAQEVRGYLTSLAIKFTPCLGCYKGVTEMSYVTTWADFDRIAGQLCAGQESVLILGSKDSLNRHKATLLFNWPKCGTINSGLNQWDPVDLGRMYSVPVAEAHKREAWTIPLQQSGHEVLAFVCDHVDKFGEPIPNGWAFAGD